MPAKPFLRILYNILELTRLRSLVIDYLERKFIDDDTVGIAFVYCNYKEDQPMEMLLGSLVQQLVQRSSDISPELRTLYDTQGWKRTGPTVSELSTLLQSEVRSFSRVYILVDALDECNDYNNTRQNLLVQFQKLASARIFITSRPHITDVHTYFETYSELEVRASDDDIRAYALERISIQSRISRLVQEDKLLSDEILQSIVTTANGM